MEAVGQADFTRSGGRRRSEGRLAATSLRLLSDERLAHLAAEGNRAAFATIYERHHQALYRYCRTITRNEEDARDALQATMLNAMRAIDTKPTKLRAWLYRIAHNESISVLRSGERHAAAPLEDFEPSAEAPVESRRELSELLDDIGHLSDRQRQALVMRELGGLSYEEIADSLACSPAAAKQAAFDARGALHELAEARDTDCESIRRRISDGDRRLLRARGVRAHLRACDPCRRFDAALKTRKAKLAGLVPALSPAASAAILQSVLGGGASSAAMAGGAAAGGAAAIGGGAAAAGGGGAAAIGGGAALGGGVALKGIVAGVAALLATGGAIAVTEERSTGNAGGSGSAVQIRESETPSARGAADPRSGSAAAGGESVSGESDSGAAGAWSAGVGSGESKYQSGSAEGENSPAGSQPAGNQPPPGVHPRPPRPGPSVPGAGPRPPRPGGTSTGTRPPGAEPSGDGTAPGTGTSPAGSTQPPLDGAITPLEPRPPRDQGTAPAGTRLPIVTGE